MPGSPIFEDKLDRCQDKEPSESSCEIEVDTKGCFLVNGIARSDVSRWLFLDCGTLAHTAVKQRVEVEDIPDIGCWHKMRCLLVLRCI